MFCLLDHYYGYNLQLNQDGQYFFVEIEDIFRIIFITYQRGEGNEFRLKILVT